MHDGSITFSTALDNAQLEKDLAGLTKKIEKQERKIADLSAKRDKAKEKGIFDAAALDAEKAKLQEIKDRLADIRAMAKDKGYSAAQREEYAVQIPTVQQELKDQQTRVNALQAEWNKTENAVERYSTQLSDAESTLDRQKAEAGELVQRIETANGAAAQMAGAVDQAGTYMARFTARVKKLASRVFVFTLITTVLRGMRTWMEKVIKTNSEARQSIAMLKGALLTLAQPLVEVIIPAFTILVNVLARVVTAVAQLVSALFGKTLKQSKDGAKALYKEAGGIQAVGDAAKDAMGSLAGFDEINTISAEGSKGGGGGTGGLSGDAIKPDFKGLIGDELDKITALVSGALLAIGALLAFSGVDIPLGLALMAAGAVGLASVIFENWGAIVEALRGPIGLVTALVSGALLAIGALLLFSGINIPLGLALIAVGALGLAAVVAANWETIQQVLEGPVGAVTALVSSALLAIGVLLAFSGVNLPLGLALIAAGAIGLVAAVAANWDTVQQALEGPTGAVTGLISGLFLALGAILLFSGANVPLGLGLLASGAIGLVTSIAANWETVQNALEGPVGTITALISSALLVLGAVLLFTGAATPLGLGLIAAGAVGLATSIAANWNTVQNALRGPIGAITALVSGALLVLGIILLFTGAGIPLALGLLALGATGLAATIAPNWDFVLDAIKGAWRNVKSWWKTNAAKFFTLDYWKNLGKDIIDGFLSGLKKAWDGLASWFSGVWDSLFGNRNVSVGVSGTSSAGNYNSSSRMMYQSVPEVSNASIPLLAQGAVIPPNREFMAVLGDQRSGNNLEAPEDLIRQIVREESGGGSAELVQLLQSILKAIKDGHIIMVDGTVFGRTAIKTINSVTTAAGKQLLLL